jgi:MFS family permease
MFAINLAFSLGMGLYMFIMAAYARELGATPAQFGAVASAASAIGVLAVIPGGAWADRYDPRRLMKLSWAMCLPAPLIYAWAPTWQWLIPGYFLIFASFFANPAINVYITHSVPHDRLGATWGVINSAFPLGTIIGPSAGALIIRGFGMPGLFLCTFACYVASFLFLFALPPSGGPGLGHAATATPAPEIDPSDGESPVLPGVSGALPEGPPPRSAIRTILPVFLVFGTFAALANAANYVSLYLQDTQGLALSSLGWFGSAASIGGFICAPLIGRLRDKRGGHVALPVTLLLATAAYGGLLLLRTPVLLFSALVLRGGESGAFALSNTEVAARAPREGMGRIFAAFGVVTGIGGTIGPYLGGLLYGLNINLPFVVVMAGYIGLATVARLTLRPLATSRSRAV